MVRLLPGPERVQMYFVRPHVKRGDYHLFINPITGRRMWAYPRMMAEKRFATVSALGTDDATADLISLFDPRRLTEQFDRTQEELGRTQSYLKIVVGASVLTSVVAIWALTRGRD